ncbi:MAG TPA: acetyl-CoA carboxylase biotin carboxylase subunit [Kiritimatiellia bacterium]|nr:acetyl-CoA carboxylase biotin carboxylase subunit [Kiritimatiellia bacterium]HMO97946.1 acetyl-CoA carboxylase biotin carboxylase subunit [Kiritimatiellia bacterium]HMP95297.1 acetyl-CoA carboxylase biotin carboxylase subunit [Kiritimatiellia bacterium]
MFERILIANRGEIALRVIRACREMGIKSIAVYSTADQKSLHVQMADEAVCIGPPAGKDSYLKIANIISAAEVADVDAIHPGYGFLSENAHFAEICKNCNIAFIGPTPDNIRMMGNKSVARDTMKKAGVPIAPGSEGVVRTQEEALKIAHKIGYPVLIKAVAGGGGKGMRVARNDVSLVQGFMTASNEAERAFSNAEVYIEKFIDQARHIEVQVIADHHGNACHLFERDCSIQRRHQKLVEEAPSPVINEDTRKRLGRAALKAVEAVGYRNAGTIEFLYDRQSGDFYFMEMNTRIQVEHPITEEITGVDLVREQIRVASGEKLSFSQKNLEIKGHAIEFRVNAENPYRDFIPSPGHISFLKQPGGLGVRVDSHVYNGYDIPPYYDSMIGKIIVHAENRDQAIARMNRALGEFMIEGVHTTTPLGLALMADARFQKGEYTTTFLEGFLNEGFLSNESSKEAR